ncbi:murein L,D-transpeptidase catalytic domain family protein [Luteibacter sp. PPL201]|uniref:Murein L,D-transpeptidase catalytic domain family protein n=1 Tax=Luteibacter sahnii TaxID=3021977 RepID=A0ABT6B960_9GAMM|nr:murein L,D-transpeptidase catalytic domain family protein [Luteibacter sp. PPL193]MDY1549519.1 murein L,D-transpeptidase catalytic domain family protein [Luteibacter sp. PPL193]
MILPSRSPVAAASLLGALVFLASPVRAADTLGEALARLAPSADPKVIGMAVDAAECAQTQDGKPVDRLAVIDYSRPSSQPRLWVFDIARRKLLFQELVAHGKNSGDATATRFSNAPDSLASSIGLFRTSDTYMGKNGYSLRMTGLEQGVNDQALARAIVIHGASYVNEAMARVAGRIGRSWGCPAVRMAIAHKLIDALKGGQMVFSYYPDKRWLASSPYLKCSASQLARAEARVATDPGT